MLYNPELFKVNGYTQEKRLLNLCALVLEDGECSLCSLPTNADALLIVEVFPPNIQKE